MIMISTTMAAAAAAAAGAADKVFHIAHLLSYVRIYSVFFNIRTNTYTQHSVFGGLNSHFPT